MDGILIKEEKNMKEYQIKLSKDNPFQGEVRVKIPSFTERNILVKELNFSVSKDSQVAIQENIDSINKLAEIVRSNVISFKVKLEGQTFDSWDDLDYLAEVQSFYLDVGQIISKGITLGNVKKKG